jgi:putative methionine-R-sulfoxide reductase with GAF domain
MVGQCVSTGKSRIVQQNIGEANKRYANPLLPDTRAEMVLPLISRKETIGALNIQSTWSQHSQNKMFQFSRFWHLC